MNINDKIFLPSVIKVQTNFVYYRSSIIKGSLACLTVSTLVCLCLLEIFPFFSLKYVGFFVVISFIILWLLSSFVFFIKKGRFGKFTGFIQRFWRRSFIYFWLVEWVLFALFYYFLLNNSQEPIYFCDEAFTNKAFTALGYDLGFAYILLLCLLFFLFVALLRLNNNSFYQNTSHIFLFVCILVFMLCVETYQFYYLLTIFGRGSIIFDDLKGGWVFEFSTLCRRVKEQYIYFICILKYWHFLFVFISSVFIINRNFERRQHYFISVSFIFQNFLILFILNLALGIQWIKWLLLRWIDSLYFWFFCNTGDSFLTLVQRELVVLVQAIYML